MIITKKSGEKIRVTVDKKRASVIAAVIAAVTIIATSVAAAYQPYEISAEAQVLESIQTEPTLLEESIVTPLSSAKTFRLTYYCSACNSPKHSTVTAMPSSPAFIGSCASNDFPLGSKIYVEGYGELLVNDRMGTRGKIDVYRGYRERCDCDYMNNRTVRAFQIA